MKRSIKRILFTWLLVFSLLLSLTACGGKAPAATDPAPTETQEATQAPAETTEPAPAYPERDVDLPTEIPDFSEPSIRIHYQRTDNSYARWALWLWDPDGDDDGLEDDFNYQDDYGVIAAYPLSKFGDLSGGRLGLIVKSKGSWNAKDGTDADRYIVLSQFTEDENNVYHIYLAGGDENIYKTADRIVSDEITSAAFRSEKQIALNCTAKIESYKIYQDGELWNEGNGAGRKTFTIDLPEPADFTKQYAVEAQFRESGAVLRADVSMAGLYNSQSFNDLFYYDGELGALYGKDATEFKVWSPVSSRITLRLYENGTPKAVSPAEGSDDFTEIEMEKGDKGVFSCRAEGDLGGRYYTYVVYNAAYPDGKEIVDPYARSAGANGLRGMVVDPSKTDPDGWKDVGYLKTDRTALTVWEMHIADITSSPTWTGSEENRRRYLGVVEPGTTYTENGVTVSTGFDHIKELGVNAVQLQPIFDQANDETRYRFNWGYNPLNYNVPEGLYSSDPTDGYARIRELKTLVQAFYNEGITVIMDVVYNHVNGAAGSNFDVLMPGYFFRYKTDGSLSNGSGCGNETASEMPMMRKFIIDSVCYWTREYKLGGFRFDLMGLHDIETMDQVAAAAGQINDHIVIYGEPWTGGGTTLPAELQAVQANAAQFNGYGQFNDQMRDGLIKGGLNAKEATGWVTGKASGADIPSIVNGINGITSRTAVDPSDENVIGADRTVSYVTCHDNYTLYDRCLAAGVTDEAAVRKMCVLANAVVFTSKGTAFMLSGEEMLRTKGGDSNSYESSDEVNALDYSLKIRNADVFANYQALIAFKQKTAALHGASGGIETEVLADNTVICERFSSDGRDYLVVHRDGGGAGAAVDAAGYTVLLDTLGRTDAGSEPGLFVPEPYQTMILVK